jgi:hypothetical protein
VEDEAAAEEEQARQACRRKEEVLGRPACIECDDVWQTFRALGQKGRPADTLGTTRLRHGSDKHPAQTGGYQQA